MIGRQEFQPKHGTAERWDTCDCIDCRRATGRPIAPALRKALASLLRQAAEKSAEWEAAAAREWAPYSERHHFGDGTITPEMEAPYVEHRLAMSWRGTLRRMAGNLSADEPRLTQEQALELASRAGDSYIQRERAAGRDLRYDAEGRNVVAFAGLQALESVEPGRWMVSTTDLDDTRSARLVVTLRNPEQP